MADAILLGDAIKAYNLAVGHSILKDGEIISTTEIYVDILHELSHQLLRYAGGIESTKLDGGTLNGVFDDNAHSEILVSVIQGILGFAIVYDMKIPSKEGFLRQLESEYEEGGVLWDGARTYMQAIAEHLNISTKEVGERYLNTNRVIDDFKNAAESLGLIETHETASLYMAGHSTIDEYVRMGDDTIICTIKNDKRVPYAGRSYNTIHAHTGEPLTITTYPVQTMPMDEAEALYDRLMPLIQNVKNQAQAIMESEVKDSRSYFATSKPDDSLNSLLSKIDISKLVPAETTLFAQIQGEIQQYHDMTRRA